MKTIIFCFLIPGAIIAIIQASDLDNDVISYSLGDDARGLFKINKDTGELTLNKVLDREKNVSNHALSYENHGFPFLCLLQTIKIMLQLLLCLCFALGLLRISEII